MSEKIPNPNALNVTNENKEKPKRTVEFLIGGEVKSFDRDTAKEDFGVVDIVRIQPEDFPKIDPTPGWIFLHFNLKETVNRPAHPDEMQREYLIAKIEESRPGKEPVLSPDGALLAECLEAKSNVGYDELTPEQLALSLEGMRDIPSIQGEMVKRYAQSRGLSTQQIIDLGLGYTLFKIIGPAPVSNVVR